MYHLTIEHEGNSAKVVIYEGIEIGELTDLIRSTLNITGPIKSSTNKTLELSQKSKQ